MAETWHVILERRAADERQNEVLRALRDAHIDAAVNVVNECEVTVASGITLDQANKLMVRLHEIGIEAQKRQDSRGAKPPVRPETSMPVSLLALVGFALLAVLAIYAFSPAAGIVSVVAIALICTWVYRQRAARRAREAKIKLMEQKASSFLARIAQGTLTPLETGLILQKDEHGIYREEESVLLETRAVRLYGGMGTRIARVYVGGGASEARQQWRHIDTGKLVLTTKRLVFDGAQENRTFKLVDVLSVTAVALDAIEVHSQRRMKASVFMVSNPLLWAPLIEQAAKGTISLRTRP